MRWKNGLFVAFDVININFWISFLPPRPQHWQVTMKYFWIISHLVNVQTIISRHQFHLDSFRPISTPVLIVSDESCLPSPVLRLSPETSRKLIRIEAITTTWNCNSASSASDKRRNRCDLAQVDYKVDSWLWYLVVLSCFYFSSAGGETAFRDFISARAYLVIIPSSNCIAR